MNNNKNNTINIIPWHSHHTVMNADQLGKVPNTLNKIKLNYNLIRTLKNIIQVQINIKKTEK